MISHCTSSGSWSVNLPSSLCCGPSHRRPPPNPRPVFPLPHPSSHNLASFQFLDPIKCCFLPQNLCICCSLLLEMLFFCLLPGWLLYLLQVLAQISPAHGGHPWPPRWSKDGCKISVTSTLPSALRGGVYFSCPWIRARPCGCFNQPNAAEMMLCQFWAWLLR